MTQADRINHLNSGLMIGSAAAAFLVPFELFLPATAPLAAGPKLPVSRKAARKASRHRSQRRSR
jgi:hypothetical protein